MASALAIVPVNTVVAQEQEEDQVLEEVVVTGSRIVRQDFTANSPITTIDQTTFENTSTIGVETVLNQMPQFVPAVTQFTTGDVQQTGDRTIGAATVSLRGLGANRNLVLIDGKRGQPVDPTMVVDTNMIPSAAIQRVEIISGGASAVYGADAVGGVVNFILKDNFEGASFDVRYGDTQHGGNQEITISGLIGANAADDRGNVMIGIERSSRSKQEVWERDWRIEDLAEPTTGGTSFFGSDSYISNIQGTIGNNVSQSYLNQFFSGNGNLGCGPPVTPPAGGANDWSARTTAACNQTLAGDPRGVGVPQGVPNSGINYLIDRADGGLYTGLMNAAGAAGSYLYNGPTNDGDHFGRFRGLPYRVKQPNGNIKENTFWQWSSIPLERLSSFAKGHFDVSDNVRMTGQALFSRTKTLTSLGLAADTVTVWGFEIPFGTALYTGEPARGIPSSLNTNGTTNAAYLPGGRFGLNCDADGVPGCTQSEAFPLPPDIVALFNTRCATPAPVNPVTNPNGTVCSNRGDPALNTGAEANLWMNRPPDYLRETLGQARSGKNTTTTMQLGMGLEGELASGNHSWDLSLSTGRTDQVVVQSGSARLSSYRAIGTSPNFGRGYIGDPNPYGVGFAESIPTCTSGLPVITDFPMSEDCAEAISPNLKNDREVTQNVLEFNLVGDLAEMRAGPLSYAIGTTYREAGFTFSPDNLSQNQNITDPIAGLFPNEDSEGEFDVKEMYGELLIPVVSDGPTGAEHFTVELGARISDWSMPEIETLESWKALMDWGFTPRYRLRGGWNRAHRAPNLAELFLGRTQLFTLAPAQYGDVCSQRNGNPPNPNPNNVQQGGAAWSANPAAPGNSTAQAQQTLNICQAMMGGPGTQQYYGTPTPQVGVVVNNNQTTLGGVGTQNSFGNPNLQEEQADTFTLGVAMGLFEDWTLTVDYYTIEIEDMIAVESGDSLYQRCMSMQYNPTGSTLIPACVQIYRDPTNGGPANVDRSYTNTGRARVEGVDVQVNWNKMLEGGAGFGLNLVANYNLESLTQERTDLPEFDWAGTQGCALQIQCQGYDFRLFTTVNYFRGAWGLSLRHQYWPEIKSGQCITAPAGNACRIGGVQTDYQLFALTGNYRFGDKYTLRAGIENLLDEEPPMNLGDDAATPFPVMPSHVGGGATYEPLGRRGFVSLTMEF